MENPKDENGLYIKDNTSKERLRPSSKYYYRSYIKTNEGITNSYTGEITTGKMNVDFVLNSFDANSATFSGEVEFGKWNAYAYYEDITFGVLYSTNSNVDNTTAGVGNLELKMESADWYTRLVLVPDTATDIEPNTKYYYRGYYKIDGNYTLFDVVSFTTPAGAPKVSCEVASYKLIDGKVTFLCDVVWPTENKEAYEIGVEYSMNEDFKDGKRAKLSEDKFNDIENKYTVQNPDNLLPSTKYYYRSYVNNGKEVVYGKAGNFTTDKMNLGFSVDSFDETSATFSGAFGDGSWNFADKAISYGILYSTNASFDASTSGVGDVSLSVDLDFMTFSYILAPAKATGLSAGTKYYYRGYYKVNGNYTYFDIDSFSTPGSTSKVSCDIASVKVIDGKATFLCDIVWPTENKENYEIGVEYSMNSDFSNSARVKLSESSPVENDKYTVQNNGVLLPSTKYYYRSYVKNGADVVYGNAGNFTTDKMSIGFSVDSFDETSATFSGAFGDGSWNFADKAISYGILYSTNASFDASTSGVGDVSLSVDLDFMTFSYILAPAKATGLSAGTKYYYRGYYKVNGNYTYFDIDSFSTPGSTSKVSCDIASVKVIDGKATFLCDIVWPTENKENYEIGVEYSMNSDFSNSARVKLSESSPVENDKYTVQNNGVLLPSTTYYYRTYVKNGSDVTYGTAANFTTDNLNLAFALDSFDETSATFSGALGNGSWNFADKAISYGVLYSTSSSFDATTSGVCDIVLSIGLDGFFNQILSPATATGLNSGTTYYYRGYYKVNGKYVYFNITSFTTK